jgi:hypothetical protein
MTDQIFIFIIIDFFIVYSDKTCFDIFSLSCITFEENINSPLYTYILLINEDNYQIQEHGIYQFKDGVIYLIPHTSKICMGIPLFTLDFV